MPYTAAVLIDGQDSLLRNSLLSLKDFVTEGFVFHTPNYSLPHHLTINMGNFDASLNCISLFESIVDIVVDGFWYCLELGISAARVINCTSKEKFVKTINQNPHITMCLRSGVKPFLSNKLDWESPGLMLEAPLVVKAAIKVCD